MTPSFPTSTPEELQTRLQELCPCPLTLKISKAKSTYATARKAKGVLYLTLHPMFLHAPTPVLQAVARFALRQDAEARGVIRQMAHLYFNRIEPPTFDAALTNATGQFVDLQALYDRTNALYFENAVSAPIAWSRAPRYRKFRYMTFGTYDRTLPLIQINRLLDHPQVPINFIEFIVYHEMLHAVCPPYLDSRGRMRVHTAAFRAREALHPYYAFSKEWEKQSLYFFKTLLKKKK